MADELKEFTTFREIAERLKVTVKTVHNKQNDDPDFPTEYRMGRLVRFKIADVDQWIESKRVGGAA